MKYDDIINLPHHVSATRPHMPAADRAAQFSPFAALTGHDAAIQETARLTDKRIELDESAKEELGQRLQMISECGQSEVSITYFRPDDKKSGGSYVTRIGVVHNIDDCKRILIMEDGTKILLDAILSLEGSLFSD